MTFPAALQRFTDATASMRVAIEAMTNADRFGHAELDAFSAKIDDASSQIEAALQVLDLLRSHLDFRAELAAVRSRVAAESTVEPFNDEPLDTESQ